MADLGVVESMGAAGVERTPATPERPAERTPPALDAIARGLPAPVPAPIIPERPQVVAPAKTPIREDIEAALSEGLEEAYTALPPDVQARFRQVGEALAGILEPMIARGDLDLDRAHRGIVRWLEIIPKRGKYYAYFLLQEVKVKMDALLALARRQT